jgi:hypothetical protein
MSPRDRGPRRPHGPPGQDANEQLPWSIVYYQAPDGTVPALEFLDGCPGTVDAQFTAVLDAVAAAPPPRFSGGGKWEAMHGTMRAHLFLIKCWRCAPSPGRILPGSTHEPRRLGYPSRDLDRCAAALRARGRTWLSWL